MACGQMLIYAVNQHIPIITKKMRPVKVQIPTEIMLLDLSIDVSYYWKHLGRKLKLPNSKIESIDKDHINYGSIDEKSFAMLLEWKELTPNATTQILFDALKSYGKLEIALKHFPL
nr:uncharacterized protein LOC124814491 [Hydra vulgaris]